MNTRFIKLLLSTAALTSVPVFTISAVAADVVTTTTPASAVQATAAASIAPAAVAAPAILDRAEVLKTLANDLSSHYALIETLDLDFIRPWTAPVAKANVSIASAAASTASAGTVEALPITVEVIEYPQALASSMLVHVRYSQGTAILREDVVQVRAQLWRDAVTVSKPTTPGAPVSLENIETRRVDALRERDSIPASVAAQDYVFTRSIPAGRTLTWRDVSKRALVRRGQLVEISASDGALAITIKALAMQDGARGDSVRVRNVDSKREFTALVTAENRAEVRF